MIHGINWRDAITICALGIGTVIFVVGSVASFVTYLCRKQSKTRAGEPYAGKTLGL
jgi:hypothetical protein